MAERLHDVRAFEHLLRDNGFSRSQAKAIAAKGFKSVDFSSDESAEIADMVAALKQKQMMLEGKGSSAFDYFLNMVQVARTPINRIRLTVGQTKEILVAPVKLGRVTFKIDAPSYLDFTCTISYYDFSSGKPKREKETLYAHSVSTKLSGTVNRGRPPKFNPLKPDDWKRQFPEQLVLNSTKATITYHNFWKSEITDAAKGRPAQFTLSVS